MEHEMGEIWLVRVFNYFRKVQVEFFLDGLLIESRKVRVCDLEKEVVSPLMGGFLRLANVTGVLKVIGPPTKRSTTGGRAVAYPVRFEGAEGVLLIDIRKPRALAP